MDVQKYNRLATLEKTVLLLHFKVRILLSAIRNAFQLDKGCENEAASISETMTTWRESKTTNEIQLLIACDLLSYVG